jgi:ADP-heptose:LPS heptosyltransferase
VLKLLIVKANQLGDNIVFLPVVQELVSRLGAESVTLLTSPAAAAIYEGLLPQENLWLEPTEELRGAWRNPLHLARLAKRARALEADAALVAFDQGNVARLLTWMSGAPVRVGVDHPTTRTNTCLTHRLEFDAQESMPVRDWTAMRLLLYQLGIAPTNEVANLPPRPSLRHLMPAGRKPEREPRRVLIHAGASMEYKRWPVERFVALANRLSQSYEVLWSQAGASDEESVGLCDEVKMLGRGSIAEYASAMASCGMFVGNNSGPMNIAFAVGTPTVILNGAATRSWDPIWNPRRHRLLRVKGLGCQPCEHAAGPARRCGNEFEPMACMQRWSVEGVFDEIHQQWEECWGAVELSESGSRPVPDLPSVLTAPVL